MAYTTVIGFGGTNVLLDQGTGADGPNPYFHELDIARLFKQDGAIAVQLVNAMIGTGTTQKEAFVLVALHTIPTSGRIGPEHRIVDTNSVGAASGFAALPCPPYNHNDDVFMDPPVPA